MKPLIVSFPNLRRPGQADVGAAVAQRPGPALFSLVGVSKQYTDADAREIPILRDVSFDIAGRGMIGLIGPSGQGKSTLLNLLGGLDTDYAGEIRCMGVGLPRTDQAALQRYRARCVSYVFQDLNLISHLTAEENAALPRLCGGAARAEALAAARHALAALGIEELAGRRPGRLSGGQKQRVAIARAFASRAKVILADEPTGSLDPENAERVMAALGRLCRRYERPCVVVTHNLELAARHCNRILRIASGRIEDVTRQLVGQAPSRAATATIAPVSDAGPGRRVLVVDQEESHVK